MRDCINQIETLQQRTPQSHREALRVHTPECAEYSCERNGGVGDGMVK
jgi:hypothetical protein